MRPLAAELSLCQRYYSVLSGANSGISNMSGNGVMINVNTPNTLRQSSNIKVESQGTPLLRGNGQSYSLSVDAIAFNGRENNLIQLFVSTNVSAMSVYYLQGLRVLIDAEIY